MTGRRAPLAGWFAVLAVALAVLHGTGRGSLAPPPLTEPSAWLGWLEVRGPVVAAVAVVRLAALGAGWYLLVVSGVGAAVRLVRAPRLVAVADRVTLPAVRRLLVTATTTVSLASGLAPAVASPAASGLGGVAAAAQPAPTSTSTVPPERPSPTLTMRLLQPGESAPGSTTVNQPPPRAPTVEPQAGARAGPVGATWTVTAGECFWSIAENVLTAAWGRTVTDAEIVRYWTSLIDANRHKLAVAGNPHLIFPGQVFAVPPPPAPPARAG